MRKKWSVKELFSGRGLILLILAAVFLKGLIFVMVIPLWQDNDEIEHFAYTYYLSEEKRFPPFRSDLSNHWDLVVAPELTAANEILESDKVGTAVWQKNQLLHQDFSAAKNSDGAASQLASLSRQISPTEYKNPAGSYSPLYYVIEAAPYLAFHQASIFARAAAMRIFNLTFLLLTVFFAYRLAILLLKSRPAAASVAIIIGFLPRFSYTSAGINNDALIIALGTIFIYLIFKYLPARPTSGRLALLGLIFILGLLSKPHFIVFTVPLIIFLIYKFMQDKKIWRILAIALLIIIIAVITLNYFSDNIVGRTGEYFLNALSRQENSAPHDIKTAVAYVGLRYVFLYASYFFSSGCCHEITIAPAIQAIFGLSLGLSFFGVILYLLNYKNNLKNNQKRLAFILLLSFPVLLECSFLVIFLRQPLLSGTVDFPIDGRYLYPVISVLTVLFIIGLRQIIPDRFQKIAYLIISLGMIFINTIGLIFYIIPRFYL